MSLNRLFCPHCETYVDVEITTVARSCVCPSCGKMIFLQFTSKESRQKRKALLMPTEQAHSAGEISVMETESEPLSVATVAAVQKPAYQRVEHTMEAQNPDTGSLHKVPTQVFAKHQVTELPNKPRVLSDNVVDRMNHDPEVRTNKRKFIIGLASVLALIVLTILGNQFQWWTAIGNNVATLSEKILVKGKVESRDEVAAETAKKVSVDGAKIAPSLVRTGVPTANLSERDQAQSAVAAFLNAKDITERLPHVRDSALTEKMMREYYQREKDGPVTFEKVEEVEINPEGENTFAYIVTLSNGAKRRLILGKSSGGQYLVDWASFVLYGQMNWKSFMEKKPENPVLLRVLVSTDTYYENEFSNRSRYGCLKLADPSQESSPPIYAYFTSSSTLGRSLSFVMRSSLDQAVPMTLTLKYPSGSKVDNQVLIDEMVTQGWVTKGR